MALMNVILGLSGAGKDTVAGLLGESETVANIKFSIPMKRMLEVAYCLPSGYLDIREARYEISPTGVQYLELMLRCFEHLRTIDPHIMFPGTQEAFDAAIARGASPVFTDVRSPEETEFLRMQVDQGHQLVLWGVSRPGSRMLPSDTGLLKNLDTLTPVATYVADVYNTGTLDFLRCQVRQHLGAVKVLLEAPC